MRVTNPTVTKMKDGAPATEYKENEMDDLALKATLMRCYQIFKMFHGTFASIQQKYGEDGLKQRMSDFMELYIPTLKSEQINLYSTLDGVHFLPVDRNIYLGIQTFIHLVENTFPSIKQTFFPAR